MPTTTTRPTVELWIRTLPVGEADAHDELLARLRALERRGRLDDVELHTWPHEVAIDEPATPHERQVVDRVVDFRRWAARRGARLPGLETTVTAGVGRMGPAYEALRLPETVLAVFRDGVLVWVAPCELEGRTHTPLEWVAEAERGRLIEVATDALLTVA